MVHASDRGIHIIPCGEYFRNNPELVKPRYNCVERLYLLWVLVMADGVEIYSEVTGALQWSARFSPLHLVSIATLNSVSTALANVGTCSEVLFEFPISSVNSPTPAFRCASRFSVFTISRNLVTNTWRIFVIVSGAVGTPVTMYLFDNAPPAAASGGFEIYSATGVRTFSLASRPVRIVGRVAFSAPFSGSAARTYAVIRSALYARHQSAGGGAPYAIDEYTGSFTINAGAGSVTAAAWNHRSYSSGASIGNLLVGTLSGLVIDVTNY